MIHRRKRSRKKKAISKSWGLIGLLIILPLTLIAVMLKGHFFVNASLSTLNFQPAAPYYATFFYPWSKNPNTDGVWSYWEDLGHTPPQNWFSNYLPDPNSTAFDPENELYSSNNDQIIYWQLQKMAEAKLEVAISSWWGQNHKTDVVLRHIVTDVMNRPDNPYPNLRWAFYYEREGDFDPPVEQIVSDINYIKTTYMNQPGTLKINDLPVIFVYAGASDSANMTARWAQARQQTPFYYCLKVFGGYAADPNQPNCWHQYAPATRFHQFAPYYFDVSPGFWKDGEAPRLDRDLTAFRSAVQQMVAADTIWKVTTTWNEWGEGTGVEPADQVIQTKTGLATLNPDGAPFKNQYIDVLNELLPPLEQGLGQPTGTLEPAATDTPAPVPSDTPAPTPTNMPTPSNTPTPTATPAPVQVTLAAIADTYVDSSNKSKNYGKATNFLTDSSPNKIDYLKFNLTSYAGKTIVSAKLKIFVSSNPSAGSQRVKLVTNPNWSEYSMTYNSKYSLSSSTLATISSGNRKNIWITVDVTQGIIGKAGQLVSLGIDTSSSDEISFSSRETVNKPTLILQYK